MLFNSIEFGLFLPIVFLLYWFFFHKNLRIQNLFIVAASYFFYGWWDWHFLLLMSFTTLLSFGSGWAIEQARKQPEGQGEKKARLISILNIVVNLLILGIFKYYNFFVENFTEAFLLFGKKLNISTLHFILPVGISFYTFQALSYSIDVYKKKIKASNDIIAFFAFVSFFPQLVAGPIERATHLLPQFYVRRHFVNREAVSGMKQILWGLFKKMVVADNCSVLVDTIYGSYSEQNGLILTLGAILFAFQIYGDFSGYSDVAIGTAKLFGFNLMRNFNYPYFSRDIAEFWRRWHISLTTWFRDYLYIPLGGSRGTKGLVVRNTFIIFLVSGFWHGANWTFIVWGAFHAILFLPLILWNKNRKYIDSVAQGRIFPSLKETFQMGVTFAWVVIGWIFFRAPSVSDAVRYIKGIFYSDISFFDGPTQEAFHQTISNYALVYSIVSILLMLVLEWIYRADSFGFNISIKNKFVRWSAYLSLCILIYLTHGNSSIFIYFQF